MDYYTYIVCDPKKCGPYVYGSFSFNYEPFYVGKGKGNRYKEYKQKNNLVCNKTIKILKSGLQPIYIKLPYSYEEHSFDFESYLVELIGRKDIGTGPLLNLMEGGKGSWDHINCRTNYRNAMLGRHHKENTKQLLREAQQKHYANGGKNPMEGIQSPVKDCQWWNNNIIEVLTKEQPQGFCKGRLQSSKRIPPKPDGKKWFTDGKMNKLCFEQPCGFKPGKTI